MNKRKKRILFPYFDDKIARRVPTRSTSFLFFSSFFVVNIMLVDNHVRKLKQETKGLDRMAEKNIGQLSFESIYQQYRYLWAKGCNSPFTYNRISNFLEWQLIMFESTRKQV